MDNFTDILTQAAEKEGFTGIGAASAQDDADIFPLKKWTESGYHAGMGYMERNMDIRRSPSLLLDGARSLYVFTIPYPRFLKGASGEKYAGLALGKDYHFVIKEKLRRIAGKTFPEDRYRVFCDSAPIMERYWAEKCGLGFIGKNNFLISCSSGARVLIGIIISTRALEDREMAAIKEWNAAHAAIAPYAERATTDKTSTATGACNSRDSWREDPCLNCDLCLKACPNGALKGRGMLDASRCISYNTIESKTPIPDLLDTHGWIIGCEECLLACPYEALPMQSAGPKDNSLCSTGNAAVMGASGTDPSFSCNTGLLSGTGAEGWIEMDKAAFKKSFKGTAFERPGLGKIKSNVEKYIKDYLQTH